MATLDDLLADPLAGRGTASANLDSLMADPLAGKRPVPSTGAPMDGSATNPPQVGQSLDALLADPLGGPGDAVPVIGAPRTPQAAIVQPLADTAGSIMQRVSDAWSGGLEKAEEKQAYLRGEAQKLERFKAQTDAMSVVALEEGLRAIDAEHSEDPVARVLSKAGLYANTFATEGIPNSFSTIAKLPSAVAEFGGEILGLPYYQGEAQRDAAFEKAISEQFPGLARKMQQVGGNDLGESFGLTAESKVSHLPYYTAKMPVDQTLKGGHIFHEREVPYVDLADYSDVDGFKPGDPNRIDNAIRLSKLLYDRARGLKAPDSKEVAPSMLAYRAEQVPAVLGSMAAAVDWTATHPLEALVTNPFDLGMQAAIATDAIGTAVGLMKSGAMKAAAKGAPGAVKAASGLQRAGEATEFVRAEMNPIRMWRHVYDGVVDGLVERLFKKPQRGLTPEDSAAVKARAAEGLTANAEMARVRHEQHASAVAEAEQRAAAALKSGDSAAHAQAILDAREATAKFDADMATLNANARRLRREEKAGAPLQLTPAGMAMERVRDTFFRYVGKSIGMKAPGLTLAVDLAERNVNMALAESQAIAAKLFEGFIEYKGLTGKEPHTVLQAAAGEFANIMEGLGKALADTDLGVAMKGTPEFAKFAEEVAAYPEVKKYFEDIHLGNEPVKLSPVGKQLVQFISRAVADDVAGNFRPDLLHLWDTAKEASADKMARAEARIEANRVRGRLDEEAQLEDFIASARDPQWVQAFFGDRPGAVETLLNAADETEALLDGRLGDTALGKVLAMEPTKTGRAKSLLNEVAKRIEEENVSGLVGEQYARTVEGVTRLRRLYNDERSLMEGWRDAAAAKVKKATGTLAEGPEHLAKTVGALEGIGLEAKGYDTLAHYRSLAKRQEAIAASRPVDQILADKAHSQMQESGYAVPGQAVADAMQWGKIRNGVIEQKGALVSELEDLAGQHLEARETLRRATDAKVAADLAVNEAKAKRKALKAAVADEPAMRVAVELYKHKERAEAALAKGGFKDIAEAQRAIAETKWTPEEADRFRRGMRAGEAWSRKFEEADAAVEAARKVAADAGRRIGEAKNAFAGVSKRIEKAQADLQATSTLSSVVHPIADDVLRIFKDPNNYGLQNRRFGSIRQAIPKLDQIQQQTVQALLQYDWFRSIVEDGDGSLRNRYARAFDDAVKEGVFDEDIAKGAGPSLFGRVSSYFPTMNKEFVKKWGEAYLSTQKSVRGGAFVSPLLKADTGEVRAYKAYTDMIGMWKTAVDDLTFMTEQRRMFNATAQILGDQGKAFKRPDSFVDGVSSVHVPSAEGHFGDGTFYRPTKEYFPSDRLQARQAKFVEQTFGKEMAQRLGDMRRQPVYIGPDARPWALIPDDPKYGMLADHFVPLEYAEWLNISDPAAVRRFVKATASDILGPSDKAYSLYKFGLAVASFSSQMRNMLTNDMTMNLTPTGRRANRMLLGEQGTIRSNARYIRKGERLGPDGKLTPTATNYASGIDMGFVKEVSRDFGMSGDAIVSYLRRVTSGEEVAAKGGLEKRWLQARIAGSTMKDYFGKAFSGTEAAFKDALAQQAAADLSLYADTTTHLANQLARNGWSQKVALEALDDVMVRGRTSPFFDSLMGGLKKVRAIDEATPAGLYALRRSVGDVMKSFEMVGETPEAVKGFMRSARDGIDQGAFRVSAQDVRQQHGIALADKTFHNYDAAADATTAMRKKWYLGGFTSPFMTWTIKQAQLVPQYLWRHPVLSLTAEALNREWDRELANYNGVLSPEAFRRALRSLPRYVSDGAIVAGVSSAAENKGLFAKSGGPALDVTFIGGANPFQPFAGTGTDAVNANWWNGQPAFIPNPLRSPLAQIVQGWGEYGLSALPGGLGSDADFKGAVNATLKALLPSLIWRLPQDLAAAAAGEPIGRSGRYSDVSDITMSGTLPIKNAKYPVADLLSRVTASAEKRFKRIESRSNRALLNAALAAVGREARGEKGAIEAFKASPELQRQVGGLKDEIIDILDREYRVLVGAPLQMRAK